MPTHLRRCDVPGHAHFWTISCFHRLGFFWLDEVKQVAVEGIHHVRQKYGICLLAYVIMPEHLHVVLYPQRRSCPDPIPVSHLLRDFKQFVGFHGKQRLRQYWRKHRGLWSERLNDWAYGRIGRQDFWSERGYDFNINTHEKLIEKVNYCHDNPVKRGLVQSAADWRWSSYRHLQLGEHGTLLMDWNGEYPIQW